PTQSYNASNYWVDVVYSSTATDTTPPSVVQTTPSSNATGVGLGTNVSAIFSEPVVAGSIVMTLRAAGNNLVSANVSYDASTRTVTLDPLASLSQSTTYSVTLSGVRDASGNVMTTLTWSFTTSAPINGAMIWGDSAIPAVPSANDTDAV